ncbi:MAG TPA: hypothetical protein VF922_06060, partial [Bradyrhizobium sp.]
KPGVPTDSLTTLRLSAAEVGRPVVAQFNEERIVARAWPASENRIAIAELTYKLSPQIPPPSWRPDVRLDKVASRRSRDGSLMRGRM